MSQARHYEMKDSGVEWIGEMPKDWNIVRFKRMHRGSNVGLSLDKDYWSTNEDDTVFYTAGLKSIHTSYKDIEPEMLTKENDLLLARNGTPYVYFPSIGAIYTDHIIRVGIENGYNKAFVRYCLQQSIANEVVDTVSIATWSVPIWNRQCLPHPSLAEQTAIADYLDEKCAAIDAIIAEAKATIEEYKAWKASVIFEAVTKGLNPNAAMKDSGVDIIGMMPEHWSLIRQRFLCKTTTGDHDTQDADPDGQYPFYVRSPNVEHSNTYTFDGEGILMAGDGVGAGKVFHYATGKIAIHQRVYCFYDFCKILPRFYFYYMSSLFSTEIDKGSAKSTVASVRLPMLKDFEISLPPKDEQEAIVAYLDSKCATIDGVIAEKEALIGELETYKKSLIFETVTGKRRVC